MLPIGSSTKKNYQTECQKGFTLIEVMSVLVIMSVMVSVAIKKIDLLSDNASITALSAAIRELNTRETVAWSKVKLSESGYTIDEDIYNAVDKSIGPDYGWNPAPNISGGRLHFRSQSIDLTRNPSKPNSPGFWK